MEPAAVAVSPPRAKIDYVAPLMQGEVEIKLAPDGLPEYARLERHNLDQKCAKRE
jgi:hypothetical protein